MTSKSPGFLSELLGRLDHAFGRPITVLSGISLASSLALMVYVDSEGRACRPQWYYSGLLGGIATFFWFLPFVLCYKGFSTLLAGISRISGRYKVVILLATLLAAWIGILGVGAGQTIDSLTKSIAWTIPWPRIADPGILIGLLLGIATLDALFVTFLEIREYLHPRAMDFREALSQATRFIEDHAYRGCKLCLCSYYPAVGAVTKADYAAEYKLFTMAMLKHSVSCVCLPGCPPAAPAHLDKLKITEIATRVAKGRPNTIEEAVASFAVMWHENGPGNSQIATMYNASIHEIRRILSALEEEEGKPPITRTSAVPDFHFVLAMREHGAPSAAFLLVPLRPAGMADPFKVKGQAPPMIGMDVDDPEILIHLHDLYRSFNPQETKAEPSEMPSTTASGELEKST